MRKRDGQYGAKVGRCSCYMFIIWFFFFRVYVCESDFRVSFIVPVDTRTHLLTRAKLLLLNLDWIGWTVGCWYIVNTLCVLQNITCTKNEPAKNSLFIFKLPSQRRLNEWWSAKMHTNTTNCITVSHQNEFPFLRLSLSLSLCLSFPHVAALVLEASAFLVAQDNHVHEHYGTNGHKLLLLICWYVSNVKF